LDPSLKTAERRLALIGESREEFAFLRRVAEGIDRRLGCAATVQFEMDPHDLRDAERAHAVVPRLEPEFQKALALPSVELARRVTEAEDRFGIPSLRRLWLADLQYWRDSVPEDELARQAIGYLEVMDRVYRSNPGLVGGYAEDSTRLIKRAFRAVARHHGGRFAVALPFVIPGRVVLVDHEDLDELTPSFADFEPAHDELARAEELIAAVRESRKQYAEPRDLRFTGRRVRNFGKLVWRNARGAPGERNRQLLLYSTKDYVLQRARIAAMRTLTDSALPEGDAVFFPLHYANDSQVAIRGEQYRNQFALVEQVAEALPYGYTLLLKPHPHFAGQVAVERMRQLRGSYENIRFLHPSVHAHEVLRHVRAVVTINSTTGFEAAMFGLPVVTLGSSLYRGKGVTYDIAHPGELPFVLSRALREGGPQPAAVARMLAYLERVSVPIMPMGYDLTPENAEMYADAFVAEFALRDSGSA
jgi:hypothetical protein